MPEITPIADVPDIVRRGQVRSHLVSFMADGPDDGQAPDEQPLEGFVTLTPTVAQMKWPTAVPPRTAVMQTLLCPVLDGWLYPPGTKVPAGDPAVSGVWVVASEQPEGLPDRVQWRASFELKGVKKQPESVVFDVPADGVVDLTTVLPASTDPGVIVVVSTVERERAEAAAVRAEEAADRAEQAEGDLDAAKAAAITTANSYTDGQVAAADMALREYADGKAASEAAAALAAAKADATSKADAAQAEAISVAAADAKTKADAAQVAAEAKAATAQSTADTAQSTADTARTEATQKAAAAEAAAVSTANAYTDTQIDAALGAVEGQITAITEGE